MTRDKHEAGHVRTHVATNTEPYFYVSAANMFKLEF